MQTSTRLGPGVWLVCRANGRYAIRFRDTDRQPVEKWVPLRTDNTTTAGKRASRFYRDYLLEVYDPWAESYEDLTVSEALTRYRRSKRGVVGDTHLADVEKIVRRLTDQAGVHHLSGITKDDVTNFVHRATLAPATRAGYYRRLRAFFSWCKRTGLILRSPVDEADRPKPGRRMPKHWTAAQLDQYLAAADDLDQQAAAHTYTEDANPRWCQHAVELIFFSGLRISEAVRLSWGDIRMPGFDVQASEPVHGRIIVSQAKGRTKSGQDRVVPMLDRARALLEHLQDTTRQTDDPAEPVLKGRDGMSPISANYTSRRFNRYREHARLPAIGLHGLRHSFAFYLLQAGVGIDHVKTFLGHSSLAVTEIYATMSPDERLRIVSDTLRSRQ